MRTHLPLAVIVIAFLIVGSLYALNTPDWQAPDEPAHYNYIRQLAGGSLPVIEPDDWDLEYQTRVISSLFDPQYSVLSFEYEDYQPPLYYLVATPLYWIFDGALTPIRLLSLAFGAGVIVLAYFITLRLFPDRPWLALVVAAIVAFIPQHMAMLASANNDSLAELLIAAILLLLVGLSRQTQHRDGGTKESSSTTSLMKADALALGDRVQLERRNLLLIGILLGLGFITKVTVYIMVPVAGLVLLWIYWGNWRQLLKAALYLFVPALIIGLGWWLRNMIVYGELDALGTQAHNAIVLGQPRTADWVVENGFMNTMQFLSRTTFQSFWGQFGWMGVVMPGWVYRVLLLFTVVTAGVVTWFFIRRDDRREWANSDGGVKQITNWPLVFAIMASTFGLSLLIFVVYNVTFVQPQGRYLFSALIPISIAVAFAWGMLIWPVTRRWPALAYLLPLGLAIGLVGLDLLALYRFIVPALG